MMRGTFGNIRLRNRLTPDVEGGWTLHLPDKVKMFIYDAAMQYQREGTPLLVIAGQEYGTGSSRDWAAKGTVLLGIRAVLAESFERIHRSNLLGMGVLPLQFNPGETPATLGLTGTERYDLHGLQRVAPGAQVEIAVQRDDGSRFVFQAVARLDSAIEAEYYRQGGILPTVLRSMLA
jgi:aconitate hydratase